MKQGKENAGEVLLKLACVNALVASLLPKLARTTARRLRDGENSVTTRPVSTCPSRLTVEAVGFEPLDAGPDVSVTCRRIPPRAAFSVLTNRFMLTRTIRRADAFVASCCRCFPKI